MQRQQQLLRGCRRATGALIALLFAGTAWARATGYLTYHFDNGRDGWNSAERVLTQRNAGALQKIGDYALDGEVDAQPLYRDGVAYVVTENDTLYAVDPRRGVLWTRHFGAPVPAPLEGSCPATVPSVGIFSTPVIDATTGTLYLVASSLEAGSVRFRLHAVDATTGQELRSADISADVGDTLTQRQRAALLEANASVYVALAGVCDRNPATTYGRILRYSAATLERRDAFVTTASPKCRDYHYGTIWGLGFGPAADSAGNVYVSTGNGCIDYARLPAGGYADAVLRLTPNLRLANLTDAFFAPCTARGDNAHDQEMGSGGVVLAPSTPFAVAGGKTGVTFVLDRSHLGGYRAQCPDRVAYESRTNWGVWGGPVAWRSAGSTFVAIAGTGPQGIRTYELMPSGRLALRSETGIQLVNGGESAAVTSNGAASPRSVVLWTLTRPTTGTISLRAYDPLDLRHPLLSVPAGSWANPGGYASATPTVADGWVFVATDRELTVWTIPR